MVSFARQALVLGAMAQFACFGAAEVDLGASGQTPSSAASTVSSAPHQSLPVEPAFVLEREQLLLLPFSVRLTKVAAVLGVSEADPSLDPLRAARLELGDGDFANGIRPDRAWTTSKLTLWVKLLNPLCASSQLKTRFPLPAALPSLIQVAYGRRATASDQVSIDEALSGVTLTSDERQELICLGVLTSAEFVSR
jgi:hypothetical protein